MSNIEQTVQARLFELQDPKYRDFQCKLMPTVDPDTVIGVRTPELRKLAKAFGKDPEAADYLKILPHKYYEENNLHGFLIETMKDYNQRPPVSESMTVTRRAVASDRKATAPRICRNR